MTDGPVQIDASTTRAVLWSYVAAAGLAALILFDASISGSEPDLLLRAVMVAGLFLYSSDVLETAAVGTREQARSEPDLWVMGLLNGWFFAMFLLILLWDGVDRIPVTAVGAGLGGVCYGVLMTLGLWRAQTVRQAQLYDLSSPVSDRTKAHLFWRVWPVLAICFVGAMVVWPPTTGWDPAYILFQMIFLPFLVTYYPARRGLPLWLHPTVRRLCGIALLLAGLFLPG